MRRMAALASEGTAEKLRSTMKDDMRDLWKEEIPLIMKEYDKRFELIEQKQQSMEATLKSTRDELAQLKVMLQNGAVVGGGSRSPASAVYTPGTFSSGDFVPRFCTLKGFCTDWKRNTGALEPDEAVSLVDSVMGALPAHLKLNINYEATKRGCSMHINCKKIDMYFVNGLARQYISSVKEAIASHLEASTGAGDVPAGTYVVLQPSPQKQREYSLGGRARARLEELGMTGFKIDYGYTGAGTVGVYWKPSPEAYQDYKAKQPRPDALPLRPRFALLMGYEKGEWKFSDKLTGLCELAGVEEEELKRIAEAID